MLCPPVFADSPPDRIGVRRGQLCVRGGLGVGLRLDGHRRTWIPNLCAVGTANAPPCRLFKNNGYCLKIHHAVSHLFLRLDWMKIVYLPEITMQARCSRNIKFILEVIRCQWLAEGRGGFGNHNAIFYDLRLDYIFYIYTVYTYRELKQRFNKLLVSWNRFQSSVSKIGHCKIE